MAPHGRAKQVVFGFPIGHPVRRFSPGDFKRSTSMGCPRSIILVCMLALAATVFAEETVTVDGATITIPENWKRADSDDAVVLTPRDLPANETCTLTLVGGDTSKGAIQAQLETEW